MSLVSLMPHHFLRVQIAFRQRSSLTHCKSKLQEIIALSTVNSEALSLLYAKFYTFASRILRTILRVKTSLSSYHLLAGLTAILFNP